MSSGASASLPLACPPHLVVVLGRLLVADDGIPDGEGAAQADLPPLRRELRADHGRVTVVAPRVVLGDGLGVDQVDGVDAAGRVGDLRRRGKEKDGSVNRCSRRTRWALLPAHTLGHRLPLPLLFPSRSGR